MIAQSKQKPAPFSAVLLWKFSRFARNQEESIFYKRMLRKNGIEVISVSEPMIDGPFGTLIERIIEWSDEYYSIRLSGEVRRGMREKVERGGVVSVAAFGYKIQDGDYVINENTAPFVKKIFHDFLNDVPVLKIAKNLNELGIKTTRGNIWENRTIDYVLQNPVYIGKIRWNSERRTRRNYEDEGIIIADGTHEPIIDEDTFNKAQEKIKSNKKKYKPYTRPQGVHEYMLHGLVKCSNCGASLSSAVKGKSLQCVKYIHGKCNVSHSISMSKINEAVISSIETAFASGCFDLTVKEKETQQTPEIDIASLIEREKLKLRRITEAYEDGVYTLQEYKERKELVANHIASFQAKLQEPPKESAAEIKQEFIEKHKHAPAILRNPSVSEKEKNDLLHDFVERITFNRQSETIKIFFYA
jgi:DNA invertase Pin-like site-specific DNA recombinase